MISQHISVQTTDMAIIRYKLHIKVKHSYTQCICIHSLQLHVYTTVAIHVHIIKYMLTSHIVR